MGIKVAIVKSTSVGEYIRYAICAMPNKFPEVMILLL